MFIYHIKTDPKKSKADTFMFDGDSNVQLVGDMLIFNYKKVTVMCEFEQNVSLCFNYVSKITIYPNYNSTKGNLHFVWFCYLS